MKNKSTNKQINEYKIDFGLRNITRCQDWHFSNNTYTLHGFDFHSVFIIMWVETPGALSDPIWHAAIFIDSSMQSPHVK